MTLHHKTIRHLEHALIPVATLDYFPRLTRREVQVIFAMRAIRRSVGGDACSELLVAMALEIDSVEAVEIVRSGFHAVGSRTGEACGVCVCSVDFGAGAPVVEDGGVGWTAGSWADGRLVSDEGC
jgi:hypothetical protein